MRFAKFLLPLAVLMSESGGDAGDGGGGGGGGGGTGGNDSAAAELAQLREQNAALAKDLADRKAAEEKAAADKAAADAEDLKAKGDHKAVADRLEKELERERAEKEGLKAKLGELDPDVKWAQNERKRQEDEVRASFEKVPKEKRAALGDKPSVEAMKAFLAGAGLDEKASGTKRMTGAGPASTQSAPGNYADMNDEQRKEWRKKLRETGAPKPQVPWV